MPTVTAPEATALPSLGESLYLANTDELKWYLSALPGKTPTRKADLVDALLIALTDPAGLARLWAQLSPEQQQVVGEVVHHGGGRYDAEVIAAKYPRVAAPRTGHDRYGYSYAYGAKREPPTAFDLLFRHVYGTGTYIPPDLAAALRRLAPTPPPLHIAGREDPPVELAVPGRRWRSETPEVSVSETERAALPS
jgi:hypothetical protein